MITINEHLYVSFHVTYEKHAQRGRKKEKKKELDLKFMIQERHAQGLISSSYKINDIFYEKV